MLYVVPQTAKPPHFNINVYIEFKRNQKSNAIFKQIHAQSSTDLCHFHIPKSGFSLMCIKNCASSDGEDNKRSWWLYTFVYAMKYICLYKKRMANSITSKLHTIGDDNQRKRNMETICQKYHKDTFVLQKIWENLNQCRGKLIHGIISHNRKLCRE